MKEFSKLKIKNLMIFAFLYGMIFLNHFSIANATKDVQPNIVYGPFLPSPLKQFKAGIADEDIMCKEGLQLVIKSEGISPACVKPDTAQILIERGWAENLPISTSGSPTLRLYLFINATRIYPGHAIGIDISVNNTLSKPVIVYEQNRWMFNVMMLNPCSHTPLGISILDGYYTQKNMTVTKQLPIYRQTILCPPTQDFVKSYEFQPLSSQAKISECIPDTQASCSGDLEMKYHVSFNGTWVSWNNFRPFNLGVYTIVGGDEWGHIIIRHFEVVNSTKG